MRNGNIASYFLICFVILPVSVRAGAVSVNLGTAGSFSVLAESAVTNTGATTLQGNLGVTTADSITGFPPGIVVGGTIHNADSLVSQAQNDLTAAYNFVSGETCDSALTGQDLGARTLTPGVYCFSSSAQLTGTLTLDGGNDPNALFLFQIGSTLTTATGSSVVFTNGGTGDGVFWQVGSSATLGTNTAFAGSILALTSITLNTGAGIESGRALARNGAVTLDTNNLSMTSLPEPATLPLLLGGSSILLLVRKRTRNTL